jgi:hypothetical protein
VQNSQRILRHGFHLIPQKRVSNQKPADIKEHINGKEGGQYNQKEGHLDLLSNC